MTLPRFKEAYGLTGWGIAAVLVAGFVAVMLAVFSIAYAIETHECTVAAHHLKRAHSYSFFGGGCYVALDNGEMIKLDNYNSFRTAK